MIKEIRKITSYCWLALAAHVVWLIRYVWLVLTGLVCWVFMYKLNETTVIGRENIPYCKNRLIISNHLTLIDSWFITMALVWPWVLRKPSLAPWHLPEAKNYASKWLLALMVRLWKGIPITRSRPRDFVRQLPSIREKLERSSLMIFPEGGRSRKPKSGRLWNWKPGAAHLAYLSKATVLPVVLRGAEDILPIGSKWMKFGQKMIILIGQPIDLSEPYKLEEKNQATEVISQVMKARLQELLASATILFEEQKRPS